jgi:hypothetical protein
MNCDLGCPFGDFGGGTDMKSSGSPLFLEAGSIVSAPFLVGVFLASNLLLFWYPSGRGMEVSRVPESLYELRFFFKVMIAVAAETKDCRYVLFTFVWARVRFRAMREGTGCWIFWSAGRIFANLFVRLGSCNEYRHCRIVTHSKSMDLVDY